jgi:hypothetical protein
MWRSILEELDAQDGLGPALPVACHRHRDKVEYVSSPGQLSRIAPDGKCHQSFLVHGTIVHDARRWLYGAM